MISEKTRAAATASANPTPRAIEPRRDRSAVPLGDPEGGAEDGAVLRAHHHGRHDQDL